MKNISIGGIMDNDVYIRILEESTKLNRQIEQLKNFILSETYEDLPTIEKVDLKRQLAHMEKYSEVLNERVSRRCG